jgi:hypothetical protein
LTDIRFFTFATAAVAGLGIAAVAEQGDALARFDQCYQFAERILRLCAFDVFIVNAPQRISVTAAGRGTAFCRCA